MSDATTITPGAITYAGVDAEGVLAGALPGGVVDRRSFAERHMLIEDRRPQLTRPSRLFKRTFDLIGATVMLALFAPLLVLVAVLIRLEDGGPALFRQTRIGRDSRSFRILKFRTMVVGADELKEDLRELNEASGLFKIADDPRVTRVGRFVRRSCIDEIPQLFNVLRGEMSLVGPRPLIPEEDCQVLGEDRARLNTAPGMTGHWQILGPARVPLQEMVAMDCRYIVTWTIWSDVSTLARTVPCVLALRGM
jgi:lipopolysaccharide/colanic/teichoic acid biosynthesis glycosyltransferase